MEVSTDPRGRRIRGSWGSFQPSYLDDKIHIALVLIAGDGSVRPDDQAAIDPGREVDMFAWGPRAELHKGSCGGAAFLLPFKIIWEV